MKAVASCLLLVLVVASPVRGDDPKSAQGEAAPLLPITSGRGPAPAAPRLVTWVDAFLFLFLTSNYGTAAYMANGDPGHVAFLGASYVDLVLLWICMKKYDRAPVGSLTRSRMRIPVWGLATLIIILFAYKASEFMPPTLKVLIWALGGASSSATFYLSFLRKRS